MIRVQNHFREDLYSNETSLQFYAQVDLFLTNTWPTYNDYK